MRVLITALCLALVGLLQGQVDRSSAGFAVAQKKAATSLNEPLIPSVSAMKVLSLGQPQVAADMLWLQTIQYFGSGNPYGNYPSLGPIVRTITDLDPKFEYPYEFGMVVLPFMGQTDAAIALGEKAQVSQPKNGLLDYYHASNYLLYKKDYAKAAFYYQKAAKEPDAPGAAAGLAGTALDQLHTSGNDRLVAIDYWKTAAENAKNDEAREQAESRMKNMEIVYGLEQAAQTYKATYGKLPATLQDLVTGKIIAAVPDSPIQRTYAIDPSTGVVSYDVPAAS